MYELPYLELEQNSSGYVRGHYEFDDDAFNDDIKAEIQKLGLKTEASILKFVKDYSDKNAYKYRGCFIEIRDDKTDDGLEIRMGSEWL